MDRATVFGTVFVEVRVLSGVPLAFIAFFLFGGIMNQVFLENMKVLLGERFDEYLNALSLPRSRGLKINTAKISTEEFEALCPFKISPVPWCEGGYFIDEEIRAAKSPLYHAGLYYLQEPSAMSPVGLSGIKKGERVLDLCAAPGGKTLQISNLVTHSGVVISNDISASRLKAVIRNVEMFGVKNTIITSVDIADMGAHRGFYSSILIDAPCSGEGMFRKDENVHEHWNEDSNLKYSRIQMQITADAMKLMNKGDHLIYSTCTFSPMENEHIVKKILDAGFDTLELPLHGMSKGIGDEDDRLLNTRRLYPFEIRGEGHFVAKLVKRQGDAEVPVAFESENVNYIQQYVDGRYEKVFFNKPPAEFEEFQEKLLSEKIRGVFRLHGEKLMLEPAFIPDLRGLRVLRRGWYLGDIKKGRFEPSNAFAMGLKYEQIKNPVSLGLDDVRLIKYLKCETIEYDCPDGWNIVCLDKYPLGFVKAKNHVLKNKYPSSWRML